MNSRRCSEKTHQFSSNFSETQKKREHFLTHPMRPAGPRAKPEEAPRSRGAQPRTRAASGASWRDPRHGHVGFRSGMQGWFGIRKSIAGTHRVHRKKEKKRMTSIDTKKCEKMPQHSVLQAGSKSGRQGDHRHLTHATSGNSTVSSTPLRTGTTSPRSGVRQEHPRRPYVRHRAP